MNRFNTRLLFTITVLTLVVAAVLVLTPARGEGRWYDQQVVEKGNRLFQQNCASCHKPNAEGTPDWKQTNEQGQYPPPPLNGSAHAWHHDMETLRRTIREGGAKLGGVMPPFEQKLTGEEIDALIAYFQSKWPDDLYRKWADRFKANDIEPIAPQDEPDVAKSAQAPDITHWLQQRLGNVQIPQPVKTEVEGIYQLQLGGREAYLTRDGRYVFTGDLIDLKTGTNLTESSRRTRASDELQGYPAQDQIVFPALGMERARIHVFTDTTCPYCKKLHAEAPQLQQAGIAIAYLAYPRGGKTGPGYPSMKQVWCAKDRQQAMSIAKGVELGELPGGDCEAAAAVDTGYELGNRLGITGTPAIFLPSGQRVDGYVPHEQLINMVLSSQTRL
jgi:thiol:disulfide interchange protein DsbC